MAQMRLDKFLVEMGIGTRSQVKEMAKKGRITVNGVTVKKSDEKIDPEQDEICADAAKIEYKEFEYYLLNKPQGVVSATEDKRYPTVVSLISTAVRGDLYPVGRLDIDTEGLLLITNDGALTHALLSPKRHVDKCYYAELSGTLPEDAKEQVRSGLTLEDGMVTLPGRLEVLETGGKTRIHLTIQEGKFHQVKRMMQALGCEVTYLKRISMGPLKLDEALKTGQYRPLTEAELSALRGGKQA